MRMKAEQNGLDFRFPELTTIVSFEQVEVWVTDTLYRGKEILLIFAHNDFSQVHNCHRSLVNI